MLTDPLRILILEDVPMDAELVEYELARARIPFTSRCVDTRESFVQELADFRPDVILSDYTLPRFDGMSALAVARQRAPSVPFLIVTGSVNEETAVGCMKAGATDYLLKSNLARIGPAIEGALERVHLQTEQARAEAALRRSEANLRAIFNNSLQCFVLVDRDGTIQALNRTAGEWSERILGRRPREGDEVRQFVPQAVPLLQAALRGETSTVELSLRDVDQVERWFEITTTPVIDERGDVIGICLDARDVSERKGAEQLLRASEERYRDLFDNASDLVCMTAPDGTFRYVNHAWQQRVGYSGEEIRRLALLDVIHPESRDRYRELIERVLGGETLTHVELVFLTREGGSITVEGNLSCTSANGRPVMIRGIYRDVTERKRVEEHLRRTERLQAAGRLAGGMAHEVNNMMTGVIGFSRFLLQTLDPTDDRRGDLEEIIRAGSRAADVTRQLLAFTRQQMLRPQLLDLNAVVLGMEKMLRRSLSEQHLLELRLSPTIGQIRADGAQLEQVLMNLVLNARDALGEQGRVTIATGTASLDEVYAQRHNEANIASGPYVLLTVSDDGCGMDRELQTRIFEPFYTTKPVGQGSGLGLSTVYGIVKQSEGFVWVYSEPGHGTTFKVYLPQLSTALPDRPVPAPPPAPCLGTETILVVEDEALVRGMASRGLREYGYCVVEAANGVLALALLEEGALRVDLMISDVVMPEMGGRELGRRVALINPSLPVLYMSGYTGDDVVQRGLLDPGLPFQQKPFMPEELARKVREMLDGKVVAS
ncbi:MAG TPA: PAS domain S-box protein [Gemmatimonadales bacterium]|jgi:PAS domain S-box-containing protein|nr:PAS domain S-box protein [Gemmatimonadales bacterium]